VGDAALGQHLRLLDPVLPVDAVGEAEGVADALDVGLHPGRDLLVAVNAQLVEAGLCRGVDQANALEVLRGRHGDGSRRRWWCGARPALRAASEAGRTTHVGERLDRASDCRLRPGGGVEAAPHEAGDGCADEVGCSHQQQGLHEQRNHHSAPEPAWRSQLRSRTT
jgi:hypothetical protein